MSLLILIIYIIGTIIWYFILDDIDKANNTKNKQGAITNCLFAVLWPVLLLLTIVLAIFVSTIKLIDWLKENINKNK